MTQPSHDSGAQLREILAVLRRRRLTIVVVLGLVITSALLVSFRQTPIYLSEAEVLVTGLDLNPLEPGASQTPNLETERRLAASLSVAEVAAEKLGGGADPSGLVIDLSVSTPRDTEILIVGYEHPDPLEAQRRAQAFSEAYLEFRRSQALDELVASSNSVQERIDELANELTEINGEIAAEPSESELPVLQARANSIVSQLAVLQQQLSELAPPDELQVGQIVEAASLPDAPASPRHAVNASLAAFLGIALGVGIAVLRDRLDDRLRGRDDLEERAGAPVLAVVPALEAGKDEDPGPVTIRAPASVASEAYRTLRTSLLFAASQAGLKTLLITSPRERDGKTTTAANLAIALANADKRVVLISADLRRPRMHRVFDVPNTVGLTSVLTREADLFSALTRPGVENLRLMPSGPIPGNPAELLGSEMMLELIERSRDAADFVLIDSAPVLPVADASILAPLVDAVLLVADSENTPGGAVTRARQQLDQVQARVVGAVLNNYDPARDRAQPLYRYYYAYETGGDGSSEEASRTTREA